jgi:hypothetical protein
MFEKFKIGARRFVAWFDASRRRALQVVFTSIAAMLVSFGFMVDGQADAWLVITAAVLQAAGPLLSVVNLRKSELAGWFITIARGTLYAFAAAIAPAITVLGFTSEQQAEHLLGVVSLGLTVLANTVAMFTSAKQVEQPPGSPYAAREDRF